MPKQKEMDTIGDASSLSSWGSDGGVSGISNITESFLPEDEGRRRDLLVFKEARFQDGVVAQDSLSMHKAVVKADPWHDEEGDWTEDDKRRGRVTKAKMHRVKALAMRDPYEGVYEVREIGAAVRGGLAHVTAEDRKSVSVHRRSKQMERGRARANTRNKTLVERKGKTDFPAMMKAFDESLSSYIKTEKFRKAIASL